MSAASDRFRTRYRHAASSADYLAKWSAAALGFSIPISTALDNLLLGLVLLGWLAGGDYREKMAAIRRNPVALLALALFTLLLLGTLHGLAPPAERLDFLGKYKDLLFIAVLITLFRDATTWRYALLGFMLAMLLTLLLSTVAGLGILPEAAFARNPVSNTVVFKLHITQNFLMAYFAFVLASAARQQPAGSRRVWLALASAAAIGNTLFLVHGRTGHIVLAVLLIFFFVRWLRWKGLALGLLAVASLSVAAYNTSPVFHDRSMKASDEYQLWRGGAPVAEDNSIGSRMQWYRAGAAIVGEHPLIGVGTGGFRHAYATRAEDATAGPRNPHNEYLLLAIQLGPLGPLLLLALFYGQWRFACRLPSTLERDLAHGLVLAMATGCLFNSFLIDHAEGLFFAWMSALLFAGLNRQDVRT